MALGTSMIMRLQMDKTQVSFGEVAGAIGQNGGDVVAIDVIHASPESTTRDLTINLPENVRESMLQAVGALPGVKVVNVSDRTFLAHLGGKIEVQPKSPVKNREDLSHVYTPGVAKVCMAIHEDRQKAFSLTVKRNMVAVVSDGTAVLGLGDIGPEAAMPVMEGKAMLFKQFGEVDAFPICLNTKDTEEIIQAVKWLAPAFGGINLEDISSPRCFEIERRLSEELDIPVFHDDQHGTAVVVLAGLLNALRIVGKELETAKIVVLGIGAAGAACVRMLLSAGAKNLIAVDKEGALVHDEEYAHEMWNWIAANSNPHQERGSLSEVIRDADVFVGVSRPGLLTVEHLHTMADDRIVFAMANPDPEIDPELAEPHVRVLATGRSDYPNQINNVLCFPGIFRGALDCRASTINEEMKVAAARAIASVVKEDELNELYIIPGVFNEQVVQEVRKGVIEAAIKTGVARRTPPEFR